ncbi:MAG: hypothetical protein JOY77_10650 [Alphaproteobacteria bacterium]|nr:hypothetical protein [Alphaproteobacteria bacterium]MBV9063368.1 hypothetical protein [Alphaproteobacteria bacterium]MBV9913497.1 hypothetical protein [Nevskiaceae bacterium]
MLFSLTHKFLFIANLKTASTAIEVVLGPYAELRLVRSEFGKHISYVKFLEHFDWLTRRIDMNEVFVWGVIREPVDYVLSVFNAHTKERFRDQPKLYTGNLSFDDFLESWAPTHPDQLRPQISRFLRADGQPGTNLLITLDTLQEGLQMVADKIDIPALKSMPRDNESPAVLSRADLNAAQLAWIEKRFRKDTEAIARWGNRLMSPGAMQA